MPAATANSARVLFRLPSQAPPLGVSRIVAAVLLATVVTWVHSAAYAAVTAAYDQQPDGYDGMPTVASTQSIAHADLGTPAASASPGTSGFVYESSGYLVATNTASVGETKVHGATRIAGEAATRGGVLSEAEIAVVRGSGTVYAQGNGAIARVLQQADGRFSVVIDGERGLITTFQNLSRSSLDRLAKNYDWTHP